MEKTLSRLVLAGTGSGCGKTTAACAVLQALVDRGLKVGAFKCGPDYLDPMFQPRHRGQERKPGLILLLPPNAPRPPGPGRR